MAFVAACAGMCSNLEKSSNAYLPDADGVGGRLSIRSVRPMMSFHLFEAHSPNFSRTFLGEEGEELHQIFLTAVETFAQFLVLGGDTHRGRVFMWHLRIITQPSTIRAEVAKPELFGSQQGHQDDVAPGLQLVRRFAAGLAREGYS